MESSVNTNAITLLVGQGLLPARFSQSCSEWRAAATATRHEGEKFVKDAEEKAKTEIKQDMPDIEKAIQAAVLLRLTDAYP